MNEQDNKQNQDNRDEAAQTALADLEAINADAIKGGEKLPTPTIPISAPPPPRK